MNCFVQFSRGKVVILAAFFLIISFQVISQDLNPKEYFGDSYNEAVNYVQSQKQIFNSLFLRFGISSKEAISIVFPEIIRYNRFRDFAETTALEVIYVQRGKDVADFSIGHFQMKPSFVEMLEKELLLHDDLLQQFQIIVKFPSTNSESEIRYERLERLKQKDWQLQYLACFIRLAEKRFSKELIEKPQDRLLILSSAYNKGLNSNYNELKTLSEKKTFPFGSTINGRFSYFDVSNYFFMHFEDKP
ncbi:MAG: hypothetical protein AB9846_10190 [Tenuifilaceae bacterium]